MRIDASARGLSMIFQVAEDGRVHLVSFGQESESEKSLKWSDICDVHLSGENPDDHHGAKLTGNSESRRLCYVSHEFVEKEDGKELIFTLANEKIRVKMHYRFYENISAVRCFSEVSCIGTEPVGLEYLSSFSFVGLPEQEGAVYLPHNAWVQEVNWRKYSLLELGLERATPFSTKRIARSNTGTWSSKEYLPMGAYESKDGCLMWQIEHNGSWAWEISDIADELYLKISGPNDREHGFYRELIPGESFVSVPVCLSFGEDFTGALSAMTDYRRKIFKNNGPNQKLPVIFNDYMHCLWADPTTEKMIPVIDRAKEVGAEFYCMDAGWYADGTWWETVGEWLPQEKRFPGGIKEVFDYIRAQGMVPGIWLEIEVMGIGCPILSQFEDECFFMRHGKKVIDHGRYHFDFRNEKVRRFATGVVDRVVMEYGVGYIKFDYNIDGGIGTEVDSDSFGDGLLAHNRAYLDWIDEICAKYPDLVIENCASGGMRMDYAQLSRLHVQSLTDLEDYRYMASIAAAAPTAVLPEQGAIWSYPQKDHDLKAVAYNMAGPMLGRIHLGGQITELSDAAFSLVKEGVSCYQALRDGLSTAHAFYPMGLPKFGDQKVCLGMDFGDKKVLTLWRQEGEDGDFSLSVTGKEVRVLYPAETKAKAELCGDSLKVTLPETYSAVVLEVK